MKYVSNENTYIFFFGMQSVMEKKKPEDDLNDFVNKIYIMCFQSCHQLIELRLLMI